MAQDLSPAAWRNHLRCDRCDVEMNHHADKMVDPRTSEEAAQADPALGGFIEETHTCPLCGDVKSRRVAGV